MDQLVLNDTISFIEARETVHKLASALAEPSARTQAMKIDHPVTRNVTNVKVLVILNKYDTVVGEAQQFCSNLMAQGNNKI